MRKKWPRTYSISTDTIVLKGADEVLNTLKYFAKSLKASPQARAQEEGNVTEVLAKAIRAARLHYEAPEIAFQAKHWLHTRGLGQCVAMLETHVLLDYLWELAGKDSSALASPGFPRHCSFLLEKQLATCEEKQIMPLPDYVPLGWTGAFSKGDEGDLPGILIIVFDGPPGTG